MNAAPRRPRSAAAQPAAPGTISGSVPFSVQVEQAEPIIVRITAQVVGAAQPVGQPAAVQHAPVAAQAAPEQGMPIWAKVALLGCIFVAVFAALFMLQGKNGNGNGKGNGSAAMAAAPASGQSEASALAAENRRLAEENRRLADGGKPAACPQAAVPAFTVENNNFCGTAPAATTTPSTRRNPVVATPPAGPASSAAKAPVSTAGIPPHGCLYTSDGTAILKGQMTVLPKGTEIARASFVDINASTDKAVAAIRDQFTNWKTDLPQRMQMCSKWSAHKAEQLQEPKGRTLGETTLIK